MRFSQMLVTIFVGFLVTFGVVGVITPEQITNDDRGLFSSETEFKFGSPAHVELASEGSFVADLDGEEVKLSFSEAPIGWGSSQYFTAVFDVESGSVLYFEDGDGNINIFAKESELEVTKYEAPIVVFFLSLLLVLVGGLVWIFCMAMLE